MKIGRLLKQVTVSGLIVVSSVIMAGCGSETTEPDTDRNSTQVNSETVSADDPISNIDHSKIQVKVVTEAEFEEVIASHIGNVVLIDTWATW